jgi:glycerol-3-phosphate dehydrogenase subunit B
MEADVVVIGGGMAGTIAALRAAALGADVVLVRKGHGSSAMSSGTIDIAGPENFLPLDAWDAIPTIGERLGEILRTNPLHPYSIIAGGRDRLEHLRHLLHQACEFTIDRVPQLKLQGSQEYNIALPSVLGTVKFSAFASSSLIDGNLCEMRDAQLLLVGVSGLMLFQAHICKQTLGRYSSLHSPSAISRIDVIEANVPRFMDALPSAPFEIARHFDNPLVAGEFAEALSKRIQPGITHIGFPPVLGLNNHGETYETFCRELGPKVFELISPNFSVPGYRLQLALENALRESPVRAVTTEVVGAECDGRNVRNLLLRDMRARRTVSARNYVVATGKFSSGGLVAGDFPAEPIFGLPLFSRDERVDDKFVQDLLEWNVQDRQLFLSCGIHIDSSLRPLDPSGEPAYENLFAAGSIIGEYDYVTDKCGLGVAMLTGYLGGEKAAA